MKLQELRNLLSQADRALLEKSFSESYKRFTKGQKEEVDLIIQDVLAGEAVSGIKKADRTAKNFEQTEQEIGYFLENAYAQNYFSPNRTIPKNQRPKWRFLVKGYIKELTAIHPGDEYHSRAVKLLLDLYRVLCNACNYYLFSTDDPFRSIGWAQDDLFQIVAKKVLEQGYSRENISSLLILASTGGLSRESLHICQQTVLASELKTSDLKYLAIDEAKKLIEAELLKLKDFKKYDSKRYSINENINNFCTIILITAIMLGEPEDAVNYYYSHCQEHDKEIILYRMLDIADIMEEDKLWLDIYKYGLQKKIEPRKSLTEAYQKRCGDSL